MNGETLRDKIPDLVAGRLDEETAREVRAYLLTDEAANDYYERVAQLYRMDLMPPMSPPSSLAGGPIPAKASARGPFVWRRIAWAAGFLLLVTGALAVIRPFGGGGGTSPEEAPVVADGGGSKTAPAHEIDDEPVASPPTSLPLLDIEIDMPELPGHYASGEWLDSREEAVLVSIYSGRPLLESYVNPYCPLSQRVCGELEKKACLETLEGFVCYREQFAGKVPEPMEGEVAAQDLIARLPAMRISGGGCDAEVYYGVCERAVQEKARTFERRCAEKAPVTESTLDQDGFDWNLEALRRTEAFLDEGRYAEAVGVLERILACRRSCSTAFGDTARSVREQIFDGLELQLQRIEVLLDGDDERRAQGEDLARRFAKRVRGLDIEARVQACCR